MKRIYTQTITRIEKLSKSDQESLIFDLVNALVAAQSVSDAALFLQDLLTKAEMKMLGKRLRIAKLLIDGMTYREIEEALHVGHGTVAKIAIWLSERGDGFRKIIQKLPRQSTNKNWEELSDWDGLKRRYSIYFWPELLLEEVIKTASKKQKDKIKNVLDKLDEKSELHKKIGKYLKYHAT
ncbi:MAG: Trp family transcriptional regulator [bacterium]|nr:Trp family transcriptional regulator [bacterium]